jgi:hypothetical protein
MQRFPNLSRSGPHEYSNLFPNLSRTGPLSCTSINRNQRKGDKEAQDPQEDGERAIDFSTFVSVVAGVVADLVAGVVA